MGVSFVKLEDVDVITTEETKVLAKLGQESVKGVEPERFAEVAELGGQETVGGNAFQSLAQDSL